MIFESRVLQFGLSRNAVRWSSALGPALVALLEGIPVRAYRQGRHLGHPREEGETDLRGLVGLVAAAKATESAVLASVEIFDTRFAAGLLALEMRRLLPRIGVSLSADVLYLPTVELGTAVRRVTWIRAVRALDCVSFPSADGCILRSRGGIGSRGTGERMLPATNGVRPFTGFAPPWVRARPGADFFNELTIRETL